LILYRRIPFRERHPAHHSPRIVPTESVPVAFVTPGYFQTMRIPVVSGRHFNQGDWLPLLTAPRDVGGANLVAIVNEAFQRRFMPTGGMLGARVTSESGSEVFTVVGVTKILRPDRAASRAESSRRGR
jgi:hypothetical protein